MNKLFTKIASLTLGLALAAGAGAFLGSRAAEGVNAVETNLTTFDFEDDGAHRPNTSNSYSSNTYEQHGVNISLTSADSVITGTPLFGSANVMMRIAKETTNSATMIIGPIDYSSDDVEITGYSYYAKGVNSLTLTSSYSTNGSSWTQGETHVNVNSSNKYTSSTISVDSPSAFYIKLDVTVTNGTSTKSNRDTQVDDVVIFGETTSVTPLESISCSSQEIQVANSLNLSSAVTFVPSNATNKNLSFEIKEGSEYIDITSDGVVTAKASGNATITITPEDTSGGATPIDVVVSTTALPAPGITVGNQYVFYAVDSTNGNYEMTGLASSVGTAASFTGDVPSCSYILDTEEGYYENTVAFKNGTKYLALTSAGNNIHSETSITANSSWIVNWDSSTNAAVVKNAVFQNRSIQFNYNNGNARFAAYVLEGQVALSLYEYVEHALVDFTIDSEVSVYKTGTATIGVTYNPADASDKTLSWSSDDTSIATVDSNGVVTGVAVGTTTITATKVIDEFNVERTCTVTVLNNVSAHRGTNDDPFNVADAVQVAKGVFVEDPDGTAIDLTKEYYVYGMITEAVTRTTSTLTFWIGDNASQTSAATGGFEVFKAAKVYGEALGTRYDSDNKVKADFVVEDYVKVKSTLTVYNGIPETTQNVADIVYSSRIEAGSYSAEVVAFAEDLLGYTCDEDGKTAPSVEAWGNFATFYAGDTLSADDKTALIGAPAVEHEVPTTNDEKVEAAMAKYDYIVGKYNKTLGFTEDYPDFIERDPAPLKNIRTETIGYNSTNTAIIVVSVIAIVSVSSIGVLLVLKRRKNHI